MQDPSIFSMKASDLSERVAVALEMGEWISKDEAQRKKKGAQEVCAAVGSLKAELAMAQASQMVGYDPPPEVKAELKKQVLAGVAPEELQLRALANADEDKALDKKCDGDATAIRRLREGLRVDKGTFKAQAPMHTFPRGSEDTVARLLEGFDSCIDKKISNMLGRFKETLERQCIFTVCMIWENALSDHGDSTFNGIEDTTLYPSLTLLMQERLGVHVYESKMRFGDGFSSIDPNDKSLTHMTGHSGLAKLSAWVNTVFQVTGTETTSESGGWESLDVLYTLAYMLWTKSDFYSDLKSLRQWLETADVEDVCLLLLFKVFSKVFSKDCCGVMMYIAEHIQQWCVHLKKHIQQDVATINSVVQNLSKKRDDADAVPPQVTELAELAANRARTKLRSIIPPFEDKKGGDWSTAEDEVNARVVEHACFGLRVNGEPCYVYSLRGWEKGLTVTYDYFMHYRMGRNARPAYVNRIQDWPEPLPYEAVEVDDPKFPMGYATAALENVSHKRSFAAHLLMIELRGALGWMDQQFHPLSAWTLHVHQLLKRAIYLSRGKRNGTTIGKSTYKTAVRQVRTCTTAMRDNDPETFRRYMGIFSEKMFAEESLTSCDNKGGNLSAELGCLLNVARTGAVGINDGYTKWIPGHVADDERLPDPDAPKEHWHEQNAAIQSRWPKLWTWMVVINELATKMDHVAVLVVDALCIGITALFPATSRSWQMYSFGDMVFNPGFKFAQEINACTKFKDTTAPIYLCSYWRKYNSGVYLSLEAASRIACSYIARTRFPDTLYTEMVEHTGMMYRLFVQRYKVDTATNGYCFAEDGGRSVLSGLGGRSTVDFANSLPLREALKLSLDHCHFGGWSRKEKLVAASAMCKYAQDTRQSIHAHQEAKMKEADPEDHAYGVRTLRWECYVNLDFARTLTDLVLSSITSSDHDDTLWDARNIGYEIDVTKKHWRSCDITFDNKVAAAQKEKRKREARVERERKEAAAAVVRKCVNNACTIVLNNARIADEQKKLNETLEKLRQVEEERAHGERRLAAYRCIERCLSWAPRVVRRKAVQVQLVADEKARRAREEEAKAREVSASALRDEARVRGLAIAIERNRAAVKRREATLARRAKVEQRALAQERRDAAKARTQAYKAEQAERQARIQAEVEATERARKEREAKAVADAAAAARAAALVAETEKVRAAEEQRRVAEATRAAREAAEHAAKVATEAAAERVRRAEQSRVERLISQHAKELARDRFAKAFELWRARVRATHTARSVRESRDALLESRRAAQERCNAIFREGVKEAEAAKAANKAKAEREREARLQADRAAHAALAAEKAKAEAEHKRASWDVLRHGEREAAKAQAAKPTPLKAPVADTASSSSSSSSSSRSSPPSSPETVAACSPGPASPEPPAAVQPPLPKEPPPSAPARGNFNEQDVQRMGEKRCDGGLQWDADYREALSVASMTSQNEWMNETGWATNRSAWFAMGGHALVMQQQLAQQQRDQHTATFHANCKHMARIRAEAHTALKKRLAERWNAQLNKEGELVSALQYEEQRLRELEAEIAEMEKQKEERRTRYAVLREYLDGLEAATEAERRELSAQRCAQLRDRTEGSYEVSLSINECVLCMDQPCEMIATGCHHVIGCEACVIQHRNCHGNVCPICKEPTAFEKMLFP